MVLCTDSTVWTWGGVEQYAGPNLGYDVTNIDQVASLHKINIPGYAGVKLIAGGTDFNYELTSDNKLYGHGKFGINMCNQAIVIYIPTELTNVTKYLPAPIAKMTTSQDVTAALLTDGTLWTWGDNTQAGIGNGQQYYGFGKDTLHGYSWKYTPNLLSVTTPYHVAPTKTFVNIWSGNLLTFNTVALDNDGQLYEWGTNKGCTIADQISGPVSGNVAYHDNSWNRKWPTPIYPWSIKTQYIATSPACIYGYSDNTWCETYDWKSRPGKKPHANAGADQTISRNNTRLDGAGSSDDVFVSYYEWSQVSKPANAPDAIIDLPAAKRPGVSGLKKGDYVFKLITIDNEWLYDSASVRIKVL
jgi:alpha-tubulin suppressor-like RCC1 family protein